MIEKLIPDWSMKPLLEALCMTRGIDPVSVATILCATDDLRRPQRSAFSLAMSDVNSFATASSLADESGTNGHRLYEFEIGS